MFGSTPLYLPERDRFPYRIISLGLYVLFLCVLVYGALTFIFPYQKYEFDFASPDAAKNNLFEPHTNNYEPLTNGKVPQSESLTLYANNPQVLESGTLKISLGKDNQDTDLSGDQVDIRRGWAATFYPKASLTDFPEAQIVSYQGSYFEQRDDVLFPFVSESAALSWMPDERIISLSMQEFTGKNLSEEIIGFRPGTLLAYADGVFFVTEDNTIRPFGSAEVLLRSGYSFDHIIQASGEDVGIYKRGKIILPGELHEAGTLFSDADSDTMFIFHSRQLWPLTPDYGEFLKKNNDVIVFSENSLQNVRSCNLTPTLWGNAFDCTANLVNLQGYGNDYQFNFISPANIDIQTIMVGLQSSRQSENARATGRSLFIRVLERIGLY